MATYAPYNYMPIFKWKRGEQTAVQLLSDEQRAAMLPIAELQDRPFDWKNDRYRKSWAAHIRAVCKSTKKYWGTTDEIAFDQDLTIEDELGETPAISPWEFLFQELWAHSIEAVPVISSLATAAEIAALVAVSNAHGRNRWLLRYVLNAEEPGPTAADVAGWFAATFALLPTSADRVDAVLDAGIVIGWDVAVESQRMAQWIAAIAGVARWRSLCLASGAFLENMTGIQPGVVQVPRTDWALFLATRAEPVAAELPLIYGDYGIRHVVAFDDDPRMLNKTANLRYAHLTHWFVYKGRSVKTYGYGQYRALCSVLVSAPSVYMGPSFSAGDAIYDSMAASTTGASGSSTTWICDAMNHHLCVVQSQLATLIWP